MSNIKNIRCGRKTNDKYIHAQMICSVLKILLLGLVREDVENIQYMATDSVMFRKGYKKDMNECVKGCAYLKHI